MKNILLPTDFSVNAYNAALYSLQLYREVQCNFILLHSYQVNGYYEGSAFVAKPNIRSIDDLERSSEKKLEDLKKDLESHIPGNNHRFETVMKNIPLEHAVNLEISFRKIEVVVIGTQGETAARDVAFGNNTINLMENVTNCPVLAVPSHVTFTGIREVVLPTGFKIGFSTGSLDYLISLVNTHHASLRILHIEEAGLDTEQEDNRSFLNKLLEPIPHSYHYLSYVSVPIGIYCFTESRGSDMIAFLNKKHSFFENLLFEPLYKKIGNFAHIPVLVLQIDHSGL
jgi:nucleotide-binding universal stress UspA family protein